MTRWTDGRIKLTKRMWKEGASAQKIADRLGGSGLTRSAILGKIHRMGLSKTRAKPVPRRKSKQQKKPARRNKLPFNFGWRTDAPVKLRRPYRFKDHSHEPVRVAHNDLERHHCRFIPGDPEGKSGYVVQFCGDETVPQQIYCMKHLQLCIPPITLVSRGVLTKAEAQELGLEGEECLV